MTTPLDLRPAGGRLPPGQIQTRKWPVLHYGAVPAIDPAHWNLTIFGAVERPLVLGWAELEARPRAEIVCDIHCVTRWSRFDTSFTGVAVSALLREAQVRPEARFAMIHGAPDYTTNLTLDDLDRPGNLVATHAGEEPLTAEHGGPVRLVVPHLYFWKSAKWLTGIELLTEEAAGFWEQNGYHLRGDPWGQERYGSDDALRMRRGSRA